MADSRHLNGKVLVACNCDCADAAQRAAIEVLLGGKAGGPREVLGWTWPKVHGLYAVSYDLAFDGVKTRIRCGEYVEVECGPIRNPVTGAESHPGVILPEGIILKHGDLGATTRFRVSHGIKYDHFRSVHGGRAVRVRAAVSDLSQGVRARDAAHVPDHSTCS